MNPMNHKPTPTLEKVVPEAEDFLPLLGTDHIELYCGNAKQSAYYYMTAGATNPSRTPASRPGTRRAFHTCCARIKSPWC